MVVDKIVVAGLDNAGKTSLLVALEKKFAYEDEIYELAPTQGVSRNKKFTFLNRQIICWDLGGQENYREQYLKYQDRFFLDIAVFYFVVDVQDVPNFPAAVEYLKKIVDFFAEREIELSIVVLLNKVDPHLVDDPQINKNIVKLKEMILMSLGKFPGDFYITSAFDIYSVMKAFSQSLSRTLSRTEIIGNVLQELVHENSLVGIMLMDSNGITFADHYQDHLTPAKMEALRTIRVLALKKIVQEGEGSVRFQDETNPTISVFCEISSFAADKATFYLIVLSEDEATISEKMAKVTPRAEQLLWEILQQ